jgi:hypothetical protein
LLGGSARADSEWSGRGRLTLGTGLDTNPARQYGAISDPTWALVAFLSGEGEWRHETLHAEGAYQLAARAFPTAIGLSTLVQTLQARFAWDALDLLSVGATGRARDRRGSNRDYTDLAGSAWVSRHPARRVELTVEALAERFAYWPNSAYSFGAPELSLAFQWGITAQHWLFASGEIGWRRYPAPAIGTDGSLLLGVPRQDLFVSGGAGYRFRGPFVIGADYRYSALLSNSFGQTLLRHQISVSAGVALPWHLFALVQASLLFTQFPDGVYLAPEVLLADDEENLNSVSVKVSRVLTPWLEVELRYSLYQGVLPTNGLRYLRHTASLGATFRWPSPH